MITKLALLVIALFSLGVTALQCRQCHDVAYQNLDKRLETALVPGSKTTCRSLTCPRPQSGNVAVCSYAVGSDYMTSKLSDSILMDVKIWDCMEVPSGDEVKSRKEIPRLAILKVFKNDFFVDSGNRFKGKISFCSTNMCNGKAGNSVSLLLLIPVCLSLLFCLF